MSFTRIKQINPDVWWIDVRIMKDRKQFRIREKIAGSRRTAEKRYNELYRELEEKAATQSLPFQSSLKTFGEVLDFYLARKNIHASSLCYFKHLKKDLGEITIDALHDHFDTFILQLKKSPTFRKTYYSQASCNRYIAWAKAACNFCMNYGKIKDNPLKNIFKSQETPRDVFINHEEQNKLMNAVKNSFPYLAPLIEYCLAVPCRLSELLNAKRDDYDRVNNVIRIKNGTTKNDAGIYKPVPESMISYFNNIPPECPYLFFRLNSGCYSQIKDFRKAWKLSLKEAGLSHTIRFHDLRHCAATEMIANGNSERAVMEVAGWRTNMLSIYYNRSGLITAKNIRFTFDNGHSSKK